MKGSIFDLFRVTFENSELGRMKRLLHLHEMAVNFGFVSIHPVRKRGRKSFFSLEGKFALMFLKMYTQLSAPKLMEQLNGNVHYQISCDVYVASGKKQLNWSNGASRYQADLYASTTERIKRQSLNKS